jgi:hypothetical protein
MGKRKVVKPFDYSFAWFENDKGVVYRIGWNKHTDRIISSIKADDLGKSAKDLIALLLTQDWKETKRGEW